MKRFTSILIALLAGVTYAGAQSIADNNYTLRNSFWFATDNASALSAHPSDIANTLSLKYDYENGAYHLQQNPQSLNDVSLQTSGQGKVGGWTLWGDFSFNNIFEKGSKFNTINYEIEEDMPFFVADTYESGWNKQAYLMSVKMASPVWYDIFSLGIKLDYDTKVGAKQKDPRCETYKRFVSIYPSATLLLGNHSLGIFAAYKSEFERTDPSNENARKTQMVFISKGLGEAQVGKVGDNDGIKVFFFDANTYGGGMQYGYNSELAELFAELSYNYTIKTSVQNPRLPMPMGKINRNSISADVKGAFGRQREHLAELGAEMKLTSGIEYLLKQNTTAFEQNWDIIAENPMSSFIRMDAHAAYEYQVCRDGRFDWSAGLDADFTMRNYSYVSPADLFSSTGALLMAHADKQFCKGSHSILLGLDGGYNLSFGAQYVSTIQPKTEKLQRMYFDDAALLASNYYKAGARVAYSYKARSVHYNIDLGAHYLKAAAMPLDRIMASVTASITF